MNSQGRSPTLGFASEVLVLLEEGAMSKPLIVLAEKLAAEDPAHLCRLKGEVRMVGIWCRKHTY